VDRTYKLYIGGKQARPDSGYAATVANASGQVVAEVAPANRKDVRNAVEAARGAARGWARATAHNRAQILYYIGENLAVRADEMARRIASLTGASAKVAADEVARSVERCFTCAAWADKYDGRVHATPFRNVTIAMNEPIGVMGIVAPETPSLLGFLGAVLPPIAMGNTVVSVASERWPLPALDCYQLFDTSDVPGGVINVLSGARDELAAVLAAHDDVDGMWYFGPAAGGAAVEKLSAGNMKRTWVDLGTPPDWLDPAIDEEFLRQATQVKNVWVPYGA
jgi:aldehyde dehydrogenase (NAD+)